mgnify:CR=1 FL=1
MATMALTIDAIGQDIARNHTAYAAEFINQRAARLYCAKFSTGQYGRIILPLLTRYYPRMNWNGQSTSVGLAVQGELEAMGYKFMHSEGTTTFEWLAAC